MQIEILLFGILRDVVGENKLTKEVVPGSSLQNLKQELVNTYPKLHQYKNYSIAVNEAYAKIDYQLKENDIIALIPPVSGG